MRNQDGDDAMCNDLLLMMIMMGGGGGAGGGRIRPSINTCKSHPNQLRL